MNRGKDPVQPVVYSLRILQSELEAATKAAANVGMKRSEFLRQAIRNETRTAQGVRRGMAA